MLFFGKEIPDYLIKICALEEHADSLLDGKLYMNQSGYFRRIENNFRGDKYDGKCPINPIGLKMKIENLEMPEPTSITFGYEDDDNVAMFCASLFDENIITKIDDTNYRFNDEFADGMQQFGNYAVILSCEEIIHKLNKKIKRMPVLCSYGKVKYENIMKSYSINLMSQKAPEWYEPFFKKDLKYKYQNEWRIVLTNYGHSLTNEFKRYYLLDIGTLEYARKMNIQNLHTCKIETHED